MLILFGNEIKYLDETIETATGKKFNLKNKKYLKNFFSFIGLPHFGARLRAYYLGKLLKKYNNNTSKSKLLDAGCGIGLNSFLASRLGYNVTGIDNDQYKISIAKKMLTKSNYENTKFLKKDLTKTNFPKNSFDFVVCFEVLEHIKNDNRAISEISKILKDKGVLFLSVPGIGFISKINKDHKHHVREGYRLGDLKQKLNRKDLKIKKIIKVEHTALGLGIRYVNDEIHRKSLLITTLLFPVFFALAIIDGLLPEMITPQNWILVAQKSIK